LTAADGHCGRPLQQDQDLKKSKPFFYKVFSGLVKPLENLVSPQKEMKMQGDL